MYVNPDNVSFDDRPHLSSVVDTPIEQEPIEHDFGCFVGRRVSLAAF